MDRSTWAKQPLVSLTSRIGDGIHGTPSYIDNGGFPFVNGNNLKQGHIVITNDTKRVSKYEFEKYYIEFDKQTLFMSINGTLGSLAKYNNEEIILGKSAAYIKCTGIDIDFLYYYLQLTEIQNQLWNIATGSTIKNLSLTSIRALEIPVPSRIIQKKITDVLSALDAKIELNNRINAELEAMAKTLYDYWFVQFDFPNANGKPYKTSCGKMIFNPTLKREIPEGWSDTKLDDVLSRTGTGLNPRDNFKLGDGQNYYITIKDIEQGKINFTDKSDRVDDEALAIIAKRSDLQIGDILFTSIEPVGVTYLIHEKPKNWDINESVFTIRANSSKVTSEFLFMLLSGKELKSFTGNSSSGSIHKGIRHGVLKSYSFAYSGYNLIEKFTIKIKPILDKQRIIENENLALKSLRDWLLPMLMNGQVKVQ